MKKYLILALALLLVLVGGTMINAYAAGTCECTYLSCCDDPNCIHIDNHCTQCVCCPSNSPSTPASPTPSPSAPTAPTPTPVTYYPDYDEVEEVAAPAPVEEVSPKTGDTAVTAAALLVGLGAAAAVITCVRRSRA